MKRKRIGSTLRAFKTSTGNPRNVTLKLGDEFGPYGKAYHKAGQSLAQPFLEGRGAFSDFDGLPVVYLYRHALELLLKAIILAGDRLMEQEGKEFTGPRFPDSLKKHGLPKLLPHVRKVFQFVGWRDRDIHEDYAPIKSFADIEALVKDIDSVDPGSFAFRYPTDTEFRESPLKPVSHSAEGKERFVGYYYSFSVNEFVKVMDPLMNLLSHAAHDLESRYKEQSTYGPERE